MRSAAADMASLASITIWSSSSTSMGAGCARDWDIELDGIASRHATININGRASGMRKFGNAAQQYSRARARARR